MGLWRRKQRRKAQGEWAEMREKHHFLGYYAVQHSQRKGSIGWKKRQEKAALPTV
jgi:hypothetical protein